MFSSTPYRLVGYPSCTCKFFRSVSSILRLRFNQTVLAFPDSSCLPAGAPFVGYVASRTFAT